MQGAREAERQCLGMELVFLYDIRGSKFKLPHFVDLACTKLEVRFKADSSYAWVITHHSSG